MGILLRGRVLFVIVALLLVTNLSFVHKSETQVLASSDTSNGWPIFRHDSYRAGRSTSKAPDDYLLWQFETGNSILSSPVVADGKAYIGSEDGKLYCLNASTGTPIWNYTLSGVASPAIVDGKVYVGSSSNFLCLNASNGTPIWNYTEHSAYSAPTVVEGRVYFGTYVDGYVHCLNASTGTPIWNYTTGGSIFSSPAVAYSNVYVGSRDG